MRLQATSVCGLKLLTLLCGRDIRTNSWVGTELYMAPEQLLGTHFSGFTGTKVGFTSTKVHILTQKALRC